jgi:chromosome partitioning protein
MPARRISFVNFKGGVGKTSLAVNVAACLAHDLGQKVLIIDCDSQSNASIWLMGVQRWNVLNSKIGRSIYGAFLPDLPPVLNNIIQSVVRKENGIVCISKLDLMPATYELMNLEEEYQDTTGNPFYYRFYEHIRSLFSQYDYIIFDCPPNLFRASRCAIFASEEIYVPCNPDRLSEIGLALLVTKIGRFHTQTVLQQQLISGYAPAKIRGIVLNDVDGKARLDVAVRYMRSTLYKARMQNVVSEDADVLSQQIRKAVFATRIVSESRPATVADGENVIKEDYLNLSRYIHNTPLNRRVEPDGIKGQNRTPRRTAK